VLQLSVAETAMTQRPQHVLCLSAAAAGAHALLDWALQDL